MAWTAPMTAVATQVFTASAFNSNIRDNLLETGPSLATGTGAFFASTSTNSLQERWMLEATVTTSQTTTSTSYTDLTTVGPTRTVETGSTAIVVFSAAMSNGTANIGSWVSVDCSFSTTVAASNDWAIKCDGSAANYVMRAMGAHRFTGLTPGYNTFTMKYRCDSGTSTYFDRHLVVIPV